MVTLKQVELHNAHWKEGNASLLRTGTLCGKAWQPLAAAAWCRVGLEQSPGARRTFGPKHGTRWQAVKITQDRGFRQGKNYVGV